jgi:hypothetical protein
MDKGEASYSELAEIINKEFAPAVPVTRMHVYQWDRRRSRNALSDPFPSHVRTKHGVQGKRKPRRLFSAEEVLRWYAAGPSPSAIRSAADNARRRELIRAE